MYMEFQTFAMKNSLRETTKKMKYAKKGKTVKIALKGDPTLKTNFLK